MAAFGLLALEFDWAMRARVWSEWRFALLRDRLARKSTAFKVAVPLGVVVLVAAAVWLTIAR